MVLTFRLYRCTTIGTGAAVAVNDPVKGPGFRTDGIRPKLDDYIQQDGTGAGLWTWIHDSRPLRICLVLATSAQHALVEADPDVRALSPEYATLADLGAWLDGPLPLAASTALEADGFPLDGVTTKREAFRRLAQVHAILQRFRWRKATLGLQVLARSLDVTLAELTLPQRDALRGFLAEEAIDTTGLIASTTLRAVLIRVVHAKGWDILRLGPLEL